MRYITVFLLFMSGGGQLYAAEAQAETVSEDAFSGSVEFGGLQTTGSTKVTTFDGKAELSYVHEKLITDFKFVATQTSDGGVLTSDNFEATLKNEYTVAYHVYLFAQLGYREDEFDGVIYEREQLLGTGYHAFTDEPLYAVDFEVGYGFRETKKVLKNKLDYDPGVHVSVEASYFWSEDDTLRALMKSESGNDDAYIKTEVEWKHKLIGKLSMALIYTQRKHIGSEVREVTLNSKATAKLGYAF